MHYNVILMPLRCSSKKTCNKPCISHYKHILFFYATLDDWIWMKQYINSKALLSATFITRTEGECLVHTDLCSHFLTIMGALRTSTKAGKKKQPEQKEKKDMYLSLASLASLSFCSILSSQICDDEVEVPDLPDLDA